MAAHQNTAHKRIYSQQIVSSNNYIFENGRNEEHLRRILLAKKNNDSNSKKTRKINSAMNTRDECVYREDNEITYAFHSAQLAKLLVSEIRRK